MMMTTSWTPNFVVIEDIEFEYSAAGYSYDNLDHDCCLDDHCLDHLKSDCDRKQMFSSPPVVHGLWTDTSASVEYQTLLTCESNDCWDFQYAEWKWRREQLRQKEKSRSRYHKYELSRKLYRKKGGRCKPQERCETLD